eukprot:jgi/Psemu1/34051/gm1.34051_g
MDIPNNNVNSDADSNISQILLSDDDRKPSAQKDPPPADTSAKKKTLNLGSVLFSHQKNNAGFSSSSSSSSDNDSIKIPPNNKKAPPTNKAPNKKAPPNPRQEAMKALLIKKSSYTRGIKATFLLCAHKASSARQTEDKKAKSFASSKGDRPQDFVGYDITKGDTFPCPKCDHMMIMQVYTTETIAAYNQMPQFNSLVPSQEEPSARSGDPKELEEDTAPKTMPGLVLIINDSIAEATSRQVLGGYSSKQARYHLQCLLLCLVPNGQQPPSWICKVPENNQGSNGLHKKKTIDSNNINQLRAKHKGKMAVPSNDTRFHQNRLVTGFPNMDDSRFLPNHSKKKPLPPPAETPIDTRAGGSLFQPITIDGETDVFNQQQPRTLMGSSTPSAIVSAKEIKQTPQ